MADQVPAGLLVVNERVVRQALDGAPPGTGIAKGVPRRQQVRVLLVELVLEPAKGPLALDGPDQPASRPFIGHRLGEVRHVLVPDPGRQGTDADQVQVVEVDWCLPVDAGVGRPEHHLPGLRVDQPAVLVVGLVSQRVSDLLKIQALQFKHGARINPAPELCPRYAPSQGRREREAFGATSASRATADAVRAAVTSPRRHHGILTAISPPSRNPAARPRLSPLQKLPGSYHPGRRPSGSSLMAWYVAA